MGPRDGGRDGGAISIASRVRMLVVGGERRDGHGVGAKREGVLQGLRQTRFLIAHCLLLASAVANLNS